MAYFSKEFSSFFKALSTNNNKEWFDDNRKIYEQEVREPFKVFVGDLIEDIKAYEKDLLVRPSDCIFRINRDIRFSKDKTPYKTHVAAHISKYGRKNSTWPGLFIQLSDKNVTLAGGVYMPEKQSLTDLRYYILNYPKAFKKAYNHPPFVEKFGSIIGEKHKRLPADLKEAAENEPLIYNKQFYYETTLPQKWIESNDLLKIIMAYYISTIPLNNFFRAIV